jgi:subtilisin family serine protease
VAGILAARRGTRAPAIAPDCSLLVRPIFSEARLEAEPPIARPGELAAAILDCVDGGARILNISAALSGAGGDEDELEEALRYTVRREVLVVAAAGNQRELAGSVITRHPWVIPVVAYDRNSRPLAQSNLGRSIGRRGLGAPGEAMASLAPEGEPAVSTGTSFAAPLVSGAAALLWSVFPDATAVGVKHALLLSSAGRRGTVAPPLLNAWRAYEVLSEPGARRALL